MTVSATQEIAEAYNDNKPIEHGTILVDTNEGMSFSFMSQEYVIAKAKKFPIEKSLNNAIKNLEDISKKLKSFESAIPKELKYKSEEKITRFNHFLQRNRRIFVDNLVVGLYSFWEEENENSGKGQVVDPSDIAVTGRYNIAKWQTVSTEGDNQENRIFFIPNVNNAEEFERPFGGFLKSLSESKPTPINITSSNSPSNSVYAISAVTVLAVGVAIKIFQRVFDKKTDNSIKLKPASTSRLLEIPKDTKKR